MKVIKVLALLIAVVASFLVLLLTITIGNTSVTQSAVTAQPTTQTQPVLNCRTQALTKDYVGPTPPVECFTNASEQMKSEVGLAWISTDKDNIKGGFASQFPKLPTLTFVDSGKHHCAAMLVDTTNKIVKAQCFDTEQQAVEATKVWRNTIPGYNK